MQLGEGVGGALGVIGGVQEGMCRAPRAKARSRMIRMRCCGHVPYAWLRGRLQEVTAMSHDGGGPVQATHARGFASGRRPVCRLPWLRRAVQAAQPPLALPLPASPSTTSQQGHPQTPTPAHALHHTRPASPRPPWRLRLAQELAAPEEAQVGLPDVAVGALVDDVVDVEQHHLQGGEGGSRQSQQRQRAAARAAGRGSGSSGGRAGPKGVWLKGTTKWVSQGNARASMVMVERCMLHSTRCLWNEGWGIHK